MVCKNILCSYKDSLVKIDFCFANQVIFIDVLSTKDQTKFSAKMGDSVRFLALMSLVPGHCSVASMRLAYKELEIDRKMEEKKLKNLEGKKREQAERLGMGFGNRR